MSAAGGGEAWRTVLEESGALVHGHFKLSSGLHSSAYVQCARLLEDPARAGRAGRALAEALSAELGGPPDSVLAPAMGALLIGHETAEALGVPFRFSERDAAGAMVLRRGFELRSGERLVIVEDVVTSGRSTRETAAGPTSATSGMACSHSPHCCARFRRRPISARGTGSTATTLRPVRA